MKSLEDNLKKLEEYSLLKENWDGYHAKPIPSSLINKCKHIVTLLSNQPKIFLTARESIQLEYELADASYLEFEIFSDRITCMIVPKRDYKKAYYPHVDDNSIIQMNQIINSFYQMKKNEFLDDNLKILEDFKTLEDDWDGEGAKSISLDLIGFIKHIVKRLDIQPDIFPLQDGSIVIEFGDLSYRYVEFSIQNNHQMELYKKDETGHSLKRTQIPYHFDKIQKELEWLESQNSVAQDNLDKLNHFLQFEQDWSEPGAQPFDKSFIIWVSEWLPQLLYQPEIFPLKDGGIQLECESGDDYLEIEITSDKKMNVFQIINKREFENDDYISFDFKRVQEEVKSFYDRT